MSWPSGRWTRGIVSIALPIALISGLLAAPAGAATLQPIGTFSQPMYVTSDIEDPDRLLVAERLGTIQLVEGGTVSPFADLSSVVGCPVGGCAGERGLMSIAVAPDFSDSGRLYVFYAQNSTGTLHVDELTASGDSAPLASRRPVISIPHSQAANHNGGQLQFGPEGNLFISTGDGGGGNDQFHQSQNLTTLLGKILRIDPEEGGGGEPYTVPAGNPFPTAAPPADTIWSYGLRNPFRFSFDRLTGGMLIGDVGQNAFEEVDYAPPASPGVAGGSGANYGWNCREGFAPGTVADDLPDEGCTTTPFVDPIFDYPHADPEDGSAHGCSIIGGFVARDASLGDLYGRYVYADLCVGDIRSLQLPATIAATATDDRSEGIPAVGGFISFGEDSCGRIYTIVGATVSRLVGATAAVCPPPEEEPPPEEGPPPAGGPPPGGSPPTTPTSTLPPTPILTSVRLGAEDGPFEAGRRVTLTAQVLPCEGRNGQRIRLHRGGRRVATEPLDDDCRATFRPRIGRRSTFRVRVPALGRYLPARSPRLTVKAG